MEVFYEKGKKYNCRVKGKPYFRTSITIDGKLRQIYGDGEKDANRKKEELKKLSASGINLDYQKANTGDVFKHWFYDIKRSDKDLKASTFTRYNSAYTKHIAPYPIMGVKLSTLNQATLQEYITGLYEDNGVSKWNVTLVYRLWNMFCSWCYDNGYVAKDPCRNLTLPGTYDHAQREIEIFTEDERRTIHNYMKDSKYEFDTIIELAFATGMRMGELLALKWSDIDDDFIHVQRSTATVTHINKNGESERYREVWDTKTKNSVRDIPMLESTKRILTKHRAQQRVFFVEHGLGTPEFVFTSESGSLIEHSNLRRSFNRMLARAGVPQRKFHAIRHTFATEAIRRGIDVKDVQLLMGHSKLQTTYIYVQSDNESRKNAIEKIGAIM